MFADFLCGIALLLTFGGIATLLGSGVFSVLYDKYHGIPRILNKVGILELLSCGICWCLVVISWTIEMMIA